MAFLAYIDPGSGTLLLQVIVAGALVLVLTVLAALIVGAVIVSAMRPSYEGAAMVRSELVGTR